MMVYYGNDIYRNSFAHYGIKGQKWGDRRFQNKDGSLTEAGKRRYREGALSDKDLAKTYNGLLNGVSKRYNSQILNFSSATAGGLSNKDLAKVHNNDLDKQQRVDDAVQSKKQREADMKNAVQNAGSLVAKDLAKVYNSMLDKNKVSTGKKSSNSIKKTLSAPGRATATVAKQMTKGKSTVDDIIKKAKAKKKVDSIVGSAASGYAIAKKARKK